MRYFLLTLIVLTCALALASAAALEQPEQKKVAAETLFDVDSSIEHSSMGVRKARQLYGYYGQPFYGSYYGSYVSPYYGGYGFGRPYYASYGGFYRPYYGFYNGFYG